MLAKRIIPCLDVADGKVVKGVRFRNHEIVGDIEELAERYSQQGADELVFYDITASADGSKVNRRWIERIAERINIPFCVAGGINSVAMVKEILFAGADKISINTPALERPELITAIAEMFGRQCVVIGIDSLFVGDLDGGDYWVRSHTGRSDKQRSTAWRTLDWISEVQKRGAGEIVLNCMDQDGVRKGYDIVQLQQARRICQVPLIASGGAGELAHFAQVFSQTDVSAALAASVFHKNLFTVAQVKAHCLSQGVRTREEIVHAQC